MEASAPSKQLIQRDSTLRFLPSQPGSPPLPWPASHQGPTKNKPPQEEVVDEITAWWQKALGTTAVLGQASNRSFPGPRSPIPKLLWTKPESGHAQQEITVVAAVPSAIEEKGARGP